MKGALKIAVLMKKIQIPTLIVLLLAHFIQNARCQTGLKAGPMLGHVEMMEAVVWLQTTESTTAQIYFWDTTKFSAQLSEPAKWVNRGVSCSEVYSTNQSNNHIAHVVVARLEPGTVYCYSIYLGGQQVNLPYSTLIKTPPLWQWRMDPPEFTVALGSCLYINDSIYDRPGKGYGSDYGILTTINAMHPDIMIWLGDNFYFREPDWYSKSGMQYRASNTRSTPEMQPLLASTHHYAIWDDHDYGPNDSDGSWHLKDLSLDIFKAYWPNPSYGVDDHKGITTAFQYGDIDFILLDNRYFRTANDCKFCPNRAYFGIWQVEWLVEQLVNSRAPFKIVAAGGQVLTTHKGNETYINLNEAERAYLLKRIDEEGIKGVVFATGDRHFTELSQLSTENGISVLDITTSSLTAGLYSNPNDKNANRVEGTLVDKDHNFCMLRFYGKRKARKMEMSIYNVAGKAMWTKTFTETN